MKSIYRSSVAWGLYGFGIGVGITLAVVILVMRLSLIHEQPSPHDFQSTVQAITTNAVNRGWHVSTPAGLREALMKSEDLPPGAVTVLELCHSDYACQMLKSHKKSSLAMMPCTLAVYERDGRVYVASLNRSMIGRFFRREAAGVLRKVRNDEKEILSFLTGAETGAMKTR